MESLGSLNISLNKFFCEQITMVVQTVHTLIYSVLRCMKNMGIVAVNSVFVLVQYL